MAIIKTLDQINEIKKSNQIIARLYRDILPKYIKPGISTYEIDKIVDDYIRSQGAIPACIGVPGPYGAFPAATCISVNEEVVHGVPNGRILQEGDIVSIDTVTNLNGYFGDSAITFPVGEIDEESKKLLEVTEKSRTIGIEMAVVGNRLGDIGHAIQQYVEKNGFSVVRDYAGHGVGLSMHEDPMVPNFGRKGRGLKIENGMVLAIEPMVNVGTYKLNMKDDGWTVVTKDGKRSAHFEHSIARIMRKMNDAVFYVEMSRPKRGYYTATYKLITREPNSLPEHEITRRFFQMLEETIRKNPPYYLWTHNRWKRTREEFDKRYEVVKGKVVPRE